MIFTVTGQTPLTDTVYRLELAGDTAAITRPGQFVQIKVPGFYLRRPISVCDWGENSLTLIYKVVGQGTKAMTSLVPGAELDLLTGLGNGFDPAACGDKPLLVGGGVGVPPLYGLCKKLLAECKEPRVILGFNTAAEVFWQREFEVLGVPLTVTTADGTQGVKGFVTDAMVPLEGKYDYVYACGPEPMLRAVHALCEKQDIHGQFSFEERMACGFGVCMGCSCQTRYGSKRICKDGPVLKREEILW
mgnify:CR=1 FL=1